MTQGAHLVEEYLESEDIRRMNWPVKSPGLIRIEHVWDSLERAIATRKHSPRAIQSLKTELLNDDEAHFWLNGYVNKQNGRIWSEANPQVYVETPLHPEKLTVWCALWAGGILLQKR
ncbi:hypothetical protein TNCV_1411791 [Trichonephila clavipes]|nr:hypothetical protein TNCV_1411791 [Trichonephila clavipes]